MTVKILFAVMLVLTVFVIYMYVAGRKEDEQIKLMDEQRKENPFAVMIYRFFSTSPLTKKYYLKVKKRYSLLYPGDDYSVIRKVNKLFSKAIVVSILCFVVVVLFSKGELFFILLGGWLTLVVFTFVIDSSLENLKDTLLEQLRDFISELRHFYHDSKRIDTAIYMALRDTPPEMGVHARKIYDMVMDVDTEGRVARYTRTAPNRFFMLLAAICASMKEYDDVEVDGRSLIVTNLSYLQAEVSVELLNNQRKRHAFAGTKLVALLPVAFLRVFEALLGNSIPEMTSYYEGAFGTISMVVTFVASFICYQLVGTLKDTGVDELTDHAFLKKLAHIPWIQRLLTMIENRHYGKTVRIGDQLKLTGNRMGTRAFLLQRFFIAMACFLAFNVMSLVVVSKQKTDALQNFKNAFADSIVPNDDYRLLLEEVAVDYAASYKYMTGRDMDDAVLAQELAEQITQEEGLKPVYAQEVATLVVERAKTATNTYYTWWILVLSFGVSVLGFYAPVWLLRYRAKTMKVVMGDEVAQFRTIILILMYRKGVSMDMALTWLERFSFCFSDSIRKCKIALNSGQQEALLELKRSESFVEFKRFCDNLLSVDKVGFAKAFDEVKTEREDYAKKREEDNKQAIEDRSHKAFLLAFIPLGIMVVGHVVLPFVATVMKLYSQVQFVF